ncbi:MAG: DNA mismatch repair endonuclease MutL [Candidatus Lokiarchaeota archaeon]|nr:DNA mismatch repair endonuclease MutL [Candidatus Lokiarchaeota archaeon]
MLRKKIERIIEAEKIAAGEVIERPANVVKELIENSIDAGANEIKLIVKKAGKYLIQLIDNGFGISPEEIEFAFERHTSSKIRSIDDLDSLETLGFRGEALASIAAVSRVEITSRTIENDLGVQLIIEGGEVKNKNLVDSPIGTNIKVKNLFYNIPARQKFLKADTTELGHISDIVQRYALSYPERHFIFRHNEIDVLNCPANNDLKTTVFHIYGKNIANNTEKIDHNDIDIEVNGLIGHGKISQKDKNVSSAFINHRYVKSETIFKAIKEAYKGTLMIGRNPFYVLNFRLDPSVIDFNVHPKKLLVRFEDEEYIYNKIYNILRGFVEENFISKEAKYIDTQLNEFVSKTVRFQNQKKQLTEIKHKNPIKEISQKIVNKPTLKGEIFEKEPNQLELIRPDRDDNLEEIESNHILSNNHYKPSKNLPHLKLISKSGQLSNNTYIILEGHNEDDEEGIYILDQHAASERINKEILLKSCDNRNNSKKQGLISPYKVDVAPSDKFFLRENLEDFKRLGFNFEHFGGNTFVLREIPTIMEKTPPIDIVKDMVSDIAKIGKDKSFENVKEEIINYLACHKSIRGGDQMNPTDVKKLLIDLFKTNDPFHCAHGRPTLKFISFKELDKLFKRSV